MESNLFLDVLLEEQIKALRQQGERFGLDEPEASLPANHRDAEGG